MTTSRFRAPVLGNQHREPVMGVVEDARAALQTLIDRGVIHNVTLREGLLPQPGGPVHHSITIVLDLDEWADPKLHRPQIAELLKAAGLTNVTFILRRRPERA